MRTDARGPSPVLVPALAITVMVVALLQTVVVPVLADIGRALHASPAAVGWTVTANLLAAAVLTPLLGRLGDVYGRRPVLLAILVVVAAGSLLAAVTTSLPLLIVARVLQGAAFGLFPLAIAVLRDALPPQRSASVLAASSVYLLPGALSGVLTAPIGGRLVHAYGGRSTLIFASLLGTAGCTLMAVLHTASWHIIVGGLLVNSAVSLGYAAMPALIVAEVRSDQTGIANGVNSIARSLGSSLASALVITLLSSHLLPIGLPPESSYVAAFVIGAVGLAFSALIVAIGLPRPATRRDTRDPVEAEQEQATALAAEWATVTGR